MITANERFIKEAMNGFQIVRGKGSLYCIKPFTPYNLIAECIASFSNKHIGKQILIVVDEYNKRMLCKYGEFGWAIDLME